MSAEQYLALLKLVSGISVFVIMLLTLKLISKSNKKSEAKNELSNVWNEFEPLEVVETIAETADIKSLVLKRKNSKRIPNFNAGQFISVQINNDPKTIRSYSISSSPNQKDIVQISVKVIPGGIGSSWIHGLKAGDQLMAMGPAGHFFDKNDLSGERIYIAGGIGITPVFSMIQSNLENGVLANMVLFYGVRTQADLAFHGQLKYWAHRHKNFQYHVKLSNESGTEFEKGYIDPNYVISKIKSFTNKSFYFCGPTAMSDPIIDTLFQAKVDEGRIFTEKFVSPTQFDESKIPFREFEVSYSGQKLKYSGKKNLLDFLESQGFAIPYSCRSGVCGSCKCRLEGKALSLTTAGLSRNEIKSGYILSCVSYPESNLKIETI